MPFSREELLRIARSQKGIINLILVNLFLVLCLVGLLIWMGPQSKSIPEVDLIGRCSSLVITVITVVFIYRMAKALRLTAWVFAVAAFIPCIGLLTLLLVNHLATQALRNQGIRVGLLGARISDLENYSPTADTPLPDDRDAVS